MLHDLVKLLLILAGLAALPIIARRMGAAQKRRDATNAIPNTADTPTDL